MKRKARRLMACFFLLACIALLLGRQPVKAQLTRENEHPIEENGLANLTGGIVLDATVTVLGREFFSGYVEAWRELDSRNRYSVTIIEVPTARFGSSIRVSVQNRTLFQSFVRPNRLAALELGRTVAGDAYQALIRAEAEQALFIDADLAPEELQ